jgi:hypothetical protein
MEYFQEDEGTSQTRRLRLVRPSESETNTRQYDSMDALIKDYLRLRDFIADLEHAKKSLDRQLERSLAAMDLDALPVSVTDDEGNDMCYQIRRVTKSLHSCDWERLRNRHPVIYAEFVEETKSTDVEIRLMEDNPTNPVLTGI